MRSYFLSIKKSNWLLISILLNSFLFIVGSVIAFVVFNNFNAWFFIFCINVGCHLIFKSCLFKFDSGCYFGTILLLIGVFYFYCSIINILYMYIVFVLLSFCVASFVTFYFYKQPFHLFLSLSLLFVTIGLLLFIIKFISLWFFLAIIAVSVILLILKFCLLR